MGGRWIIMEKGREIENDVCYDVHSTLSTLQVQPRRNYYRKDRNYFVCIRNYGYKGHMDFFPSASEN